jgi:hypothetical protein
MLLQRQDRIKVKAVTVRSIGCQQIKKQTEEGYSLGKQKAREGILEKNRIAHVSFFPAWSVCSLPSL